MHTVASVSVLGGCVGLQLLLSKGDLKDDRNCSKSSYVYACACSNFLLLSLLLLCVDQQHRALLHS